MVGGPDAVLGVWVYKWCYTGVIMPHPRRFDDALYTHFITFSYYHRRRLLVHDQPKRIFLGVLNEVREKFAAKCVGFVLMPDHPSAPD